MPPACKAAEDAQDKTGKGHDGVYCGAALELPDGSIITGKNSPIMHASSSCVLNAINKLAGLPKEILLISPEILEAISRLKGEIQKERRLSLDLGEMMIALSSSTLNNPTAKAAMDKLHDLKTCEMHLTHIPTPHFFEIRDHFLLVKLFFQFERLPRYQKHLKSNIIHHRGLQNSTKHAKLLQNSTSVKLFRLSIEFEIAS